MSLKVAALAAAATALLSAKSAVAGTNDCTFQSPYGATFDITPLQNVAALNQGVITTTGGDVPCTETVEQNYTYYMGICSEVKQEVLPSYCDASVLATKPYAVQASVQGTCDPSKPGDCHCHSAGLKQGTDGNAYTWGLVNSADPSKGVTLTYSKGEQCVHNGAPDRQVTIRFLCQDTVASTPSRAEEVSHCHYEVDIPSLYGCPTECGSSDGKVCGGKGLCGYDRTNKKAKCFCDDGWTGSGCQNVDAGSGSPLTGLLVVIFLVCLVLVGGIYFLYRQIKTYQDDTQNYIRLQASPMGDEDTV